MIFSRSFISSVLANAKPFKLENIFSIPFSITGVYILFHSRTIVYVGQSQDIRSRMRQHYDGSHNKAVRIWIDALDGDIEFAYFHCVNVDIDDAEKSMIKFLQPFANERRYHEYQPKSKIWR